MRGFEVGDCMKEYCSNGSKCRHELRQTLVYDADIEF